MRAWLYGYLTLFFNNVPFVTNISNDYPEGLVPTPAAEIRTWLKPAAEYLMAADLTALPTVAAMLEEITQSRPDARGTIFLLLPDEADLPELVRPAGIAVRPFIGGAE